MPYKYIGRRTDFKGKTLWEIVGNLKNYGIGRMVVRSRLERYPEKNYMKILKVETLSNPEKPSMDSVRKVRVWVDNTFRGKTFPEHHLIEETSYKTDFQLIPKDEEHNYYNTTIYETNKIFPKTMEFPPLLKELLIKVAQTKGENITEEPKMEVFYNQPSLNTKYKIAEGDEKPNVKIVVGLGKPASPSLYKDVKL